MKKQSLEALGAVPVEVEITTDNVPSIVHKGVYTLWKKPDGTLRVQYHRDDKEEEDFFELPGAVVALTERMSKGDMNPAEMFKEVMKMMMSMKPPGAK
jgi:hypothetical protein